MTSLPLDLQDDGDDATTAVFRTSGTEIPNGHAVSGSIPRRTDCSSSVLQSVYLGAEVSALALWPKDQTSPSGSQWTRACTSDDGLFEFTAPQALLTRTSPAGPGFVA